MRGLDLIFATIIVMKGKSYNGPRLETLSSRSDIPVYADNPQNMLLRAWKIFLLFTFKNSEHVRDRIIIRGLCVTWRRRRTTKKLT